MKHPHADPLDPPDAHADFARQPAPARRTIDVFEHEGQVAGRVTDDAGEWLVWLEGRRDVDGRVRVTELLGDPERCDPGDFGRLLAQLEGDGPIRPAFRPDGRAGSLGQGIDLLAATASSDDLWRASGRTGPSDHLTAAHRRELDALARYAEARIAATTGEDAPDLVGRAEFLTPAEFEREMPGSDLVLGAYSPDTGRLIIKDSGDLRAHAVLVHEGLHALRTERASSPVPIDLDEALTEHFTRLIDPSSAGATIERRDVDGKVVYAVPGLSEPLEAADARFVTRPTPYADRLPLIEHVESIVGRPAIWELYRSGHLATIRRLYDGRLGPGAWARLIDRVEHGDWTVPPPADRGL